MNCPKIVARVIFEHAKHVQSFGIHENLVFKHPKVLNLNFDLVDEILHER